MESQEISTPPAPADEHVTSRARRRSRLRRSVPKWLILSAVPVALGTLFICCLRLASSIPTDSDGAANILQAWAMLHGNLLLHDWHLSDVSFYTTELPEYMLVVAVRGLRPDVVQICAALTYTLCTLLVVLVAKGGATGREGTVRVAVSAGIALAPLANGQRTLLTNPDHTGTAVPVLLLLLLLEQPALRNRKPVITIVLLSASVIGDQLALVIGVAPLLAVCMLRSRLRIMTQDNRQERLLAAAACASALIGWSAPRIIRAAGGWATSAVPATFVGFGALAGNFRGAVQGLLTLFGVQFPARLGPQTAFAVIHLSGLILVAAAVWLGVRSIRSGGDLVPGILAAAIIINFAAYVVFIPDPQANLREIDIIVPLGAALAGRMLASPLIRMRMQPAVAAALACYAITLAWGLAQPARPPANLNLGDWLIGHSLTGGIAGYWAGSSLTVDTGGAVRMAAVQLHGRQPSPNPWEADMSAFNPRTHYANFLILNPPSPADPQPITERAAVAAFGVPSHVYTYQRYIIMVWHKNLLQMIRLRRAAVGVLRGQTGLYGLGVLPAQARRAAGPARGQRDSAVAERALTFTPPMSAFCPSR